LFNISGFADLDVNRLAEQTSKRFGVSDGGPQLELRVAARPYLEQCVFASIVQFQP
jgi:hypothetical protein